MTLAGAPDFQRQIAPTFTLIGTVTINGAGHVVQDVAAGIMPYHQGIECVWVASPISVGSPIFVSVALSLSQLPILDGTNVTDGGNVTATLPGALVTQSAGTQCVVDISPSPLGVSPVTGTLFVFALSAPPQVIVTHRRKYQGFGRTTGSTSVASGATTTVLPAPPAGCYYKLFHFSMGTTGVDGAALSVSIKDGSGNIMWFYRTNNTNTDRFDVPIAGMEWFDSIVVTNNSLTPFSVIVLHELWQI